MGSIIEINDTLKLPNSMLPEILELGCRYDFQLQDRRLYHLSPTRVFLVREIDGLWDYVGHCLITHMSIDAEKNLTKGIFVIQKLYTDEYRKVVNKEEAPQGKGFILR